MKIKFILLCLLFSVALTAQVTNLPTVLQVNDEGNAFNVVPKQLSYDGSNRVYIRTADDQVAIYGNDFTPVKSFNITPTYHEWNTISKERTVTVTVTRGKLISSNVVVDHTSTGLIQELYLFNEETQEGYYTYDVPASWTENDMKTYLENQEKETIVSVTPHPEGGWVFVYDMDMYQPDGRDASNYFMVDTYGKQYPEEAYLWQNGFLYDYYIEYNDESVYAEDEVTFEYGEWVETSTTKEVYAQDEGIGFLDYDSQSIVGDIEGFGDGICLSQTLFNTDDKYEDLSFQYELSEEEESSSYTPDYNYSGTYTENKYLYQYPLYKSFNVMSEDGTILQTVTFPNGFEMINDVTAQIIQLSGEFYILCQGEMNDNATLLIYKLNRSSVGASVEQVCAPIKASAFPSIANRNQMITIQLSGDNADNSRTNLQVIDMQGKVLNQQTIPAGQTRTTIPASRLSNGMNLIKITQGSKNIGTEKVIVK